MRTISPLWKWSCKRKKIILFNLYLHFEKQLKFFFFQKLTEKPHCWMRRSFPEKFYVFGLILDYKKESVTCFLLRIDQNIWEQLFCTKARNTSFTEFKQEPDIGSDIDPSGPSTNVLLYSTNAMISVYKVLPISVHWEIVITNFKWLMILKSSSRYKFKIVSQLTKHPRKLVRP